MAATKKNTTAQADKASSLIEPGRTAPAFTLVDQADRKHSLKDYRGKWVILYFYPRDNTPGCTQQACSFRDATKEMTRLDAVVLGVSPDDGRSHAKFADKFALTFPLLADTQKAVCLKYGVWQEKKLYGRTFMGVVRTTYLIAPDGKVAHRWDKVRVANHRDAVVDRLKELQNR